MPPLHPMIVHFPIALVTLSVFADMWACMRKSKTAAEVGWWALGGAALTGIITVWLGYYDMGRAALSAETHSYVSMHLTIGWTVLISVALLAVWRLIIRVRVGHLPGGAYVAVASLVLLLTWFQGWFGGEMVYSHGAGVSAAGQGTERQAAAEERLMAVKSALGGLLLRDDAHGQAVGAHGAHGLGDGHGSASGGPHGSEEEARTRTEPANR